MVQTIVGMTLCHLQTSLTGQSKYSVDNKLLACNFRAVRSIKYSAVGAPTVYIWANPDCFPTKLSTVVENAQRKRDS